MNITSIKNKLGFWLELPAELVLNISKITLYENNKLIIENFNSILEFQDEYLAVYGKKIVFRIYGNKLNIENITNDVLIINGEINKFEMIKN